MAFARAQGYEAVHLTTLEHMVPACKLYEKYGFKPTRKVRWLLTVLCGPFASRHVVQSKMQFKVHGRSEIVVVDYLLALS